MTAADGGRPPLRKAGDAGRHPTLPDAVADDLPLVRPGASTADAVLAPDAGKPVTLAVTVPKWLRKSVRAEAKRRGTTVDEVVTEALQERTIR